MADTKISALTASNPAVTADIVPIDRTGSTLSITAGSIAALALLGQFVHTSGTTHTVTANTNRIRFILVGGGGGGAGVAGNLGNAAFSGGGSAGGYTEHVIAVTPSTLYNYVVGAGGTAAANNAAGGAGTNTTLTIGASVFTAQGGVGGTNMANGLTNASTAAVANTAANTANSPDISIGGQAGRQGWRTNGVVGHSGDGGCSVRGSGGRGTDQMVATSGVKGENATNYGAGGAGGCGNSNANGGNGSTGVVIIEEYS